MKHLVTTIAVLGLISGCASRGPDDSYVRPKPSSRSWDALPAIAREALANADKFEVWAIGSDFQDGNLDLYPFHGKTAVTDSATRAALVEALARAAKESEGWRALCFEPHHGIRVTSRDETTDFVICFKCLRVQVWQRSECVASFETNETAMPVFDQVLERAGVTRKPAARAR